MKFIRVVWFDVKNGCLKNPFVYVFPILIASISFFDVRRRIAIWGTGASFGDYWLYLYGGMKKYIISIGNPFQFPILWIMVFLFSAFTVLNYPIRDLQTVGMQILVKAGGRKKWWISKCLWNFFVTLIYHGLLIGTLLVLCRCFDVPLTLEVHQKSVTSMFALGIMDFIGGNQLPVLVIMTPIVFSIAINMVQMCLSLFLKPIFSFLFVAVTMMSSAYLLSEKMIGNFAMPIRYQWAIEQGVNQEKGLILSLGILFVAVICGILKFRKYDILNKGD